MAKGKRPVYNGYDEKYMTGQEIIDTFSKAYECFGRHHERTSAYKMDWSYKPRVKPEKTYRLFVNKHFCCVLNGDTDNKLYFFGYTMEPPPYAKEGPRSAKPKYTTVYIDKTVFHTIDGEVKEAIENEPFQVICDEEGKILTDLRLLKFLFDVRYIKSFPVLITKKALVSMATYKPISKEEFIDLDGLGEKTYEICGEEFIKAIQTYLDYIGRELNTE